MAKAFGGLGVTICDAAADLPASPDEGLIVFQKDTNELKIYDGSVWRSVLDTNAPPGLVLVQPTSVSGTGVSVSNGLISFSGTSQVFVNGVFSSAFKNYRLIFNGNGSTGVIQNVRFRWRAAGTDYNNNYYNRMWYQHAGSFSTAAQDNATYAEWQYVNDLKSTWTMDIFDPNVNTYTNYIVHHDSYGSTNNLVGETHSWQGAIRSYDGFSISPNNGTISGTISIYGIRGSI